MMRVYGACWRDELVKMNTYDIQEKDNLFVKILDFLFMYISNNYSTMFLRFRAYFERGMPIFYILHNKPRRC